MGTLQRKISEKKCYLYIRVETTIGDVDGVFEDIKADTECMDGGAKVVKLKITEVLEGDPK